jgi:pSer/pThr/pTyr-binding forkhead associated (FHA) protein
MSADSTYLRLEVISGVSPGSTLVVEDELVIGRHATGAGRLSEDEEISRQHARISREATGNYAIEDLGSSNGTFVNGLRIKSPRVLDVGDSIETGATTMVVRAIVAPEPEQPAQAAETAAGEDTPPPGGRAAPTVFAPIPVAAEAEAQAPAEDAVEEEAPAHEPPPAAEPAEPASTSAPVPAPPERIPPPKLSLEIDFDAREARIALGEGGETVRLVFIDGAWRVG